jgi:DNA-binding response OmpR family regulator
MQCERHGKETEMTESEFKILVVDNDEEFQRICAEWLESDETTIVQALSAEHAIEVIGDVTPNVIILDVVLPQMSGTDFLRTIFKGKPAADIPVAIVSERNDLATKLLGYISGARRYFEKPAEKNDVINFVMSCKKGKRPSKHDCNMHSSGRIESRISLVDEMVTVARRHKCPMCLCDVV